MSTFKAAALQLNSQPDVDYNLIQLQELISKAIDAHADFIALPENFAFFGDDKEQLRLAKFISEKAESRLAEWAAEYDTYILGGGYPYSTDNQKFYNRSTLFNPNGEIIASYDKVHLFDVTISEKEYYRESEIMTAGRENTVVCDIPNLAKFGLSICYDVRFPELYRSMADESVEVITIPSAFTKTTGQAHWFPLLRARAIENTSYLIAPAQTGTHGKKETFGHATIIDPWGKILADAGTETGIITANIDLNYLSEVRTKLPSLKHRVF